MSEGRRPFRYRAGEEVRVVQTHGAKYIVCGYYGLISEHDTKKAAQAALTKAMSWYDRFPAFTPKIYTRLGK